LAGLAPELAVGDGAMTAMPIDDFTRALRSGSELAYVMPVPHRVVWPCMDARRLRMRVSWLTPETLVPLIDTRPFLIARDSVPSIAVDWDGSLRVLLPPATSGHRP
jgi:hypothetical protein